MDNYFTKQDIEDIEQSEDFIGLSRIALLILQKIPQPIVQVCGPMATGGKGNLEDNFIIFEKSIQRLIERGENVFSQMPFEGRMQSLKLLDSYKGGTQIIDEFYLPIFESGLVKKLYFIDGWETSVGASLEHEHAKRLGIEIGYL